MPSLHVIWAGWVACALWSRLRQRWMKAVTITYPSVTSVVVVATANHYLLDVVAGLAVLAVAGLAVRRSERFSPRGSGGWWPAPSGPPAGRTWCRAGA